MRDDELRLIGVGVELPVFPLRPLEGWDYQRYQLPTAMVVLPQGDVLHDLS